MPIGAKVKPLGLRNEALARPGAGWLRYDGDAALSPTNLTSADDPSCLKGIRQELDSHFLRFLLVAHDPPAPLRAPGCLECRAEVEWSNGLGNIGLQRFNISPHRIALSVAERAQLNRGWRGTFRF